MINGDKNYFYHQGRYPEDDGLFFVGIDKKEKQCLYAKIGSDISDYLSYGVRVMLAKCLAVGVAVAGRSLAVLLQKYQGFQCIYRGGLSFVDELFHGFV